MSVLQLVLILAIELVRLFAMIIREFGGRFF